MVNLVIKVNKAEEGILAKEQLARFQMALDQWSPNFLAPGTGAPMII